MKTPCCCSDRSLGGGGGGGGVCAGVVVLVLGVLVSQLVYVSAVQGSPLDSNPPAAASSPDPPADENKVVEDSKPRILEQPADDYVARNEPAKLNCKVEGHPPPTVTWFRNGQPVLTAADNPASHRMLLDSGQQLFFLRIIHNKNSKPDVGVYRCRASNAHGTVFSRNATLQLAVLREDFRESPQPVTVAAGETATFRCKPPRGLPLPKVLWRHNGSPLTPTGRITIADSGDLVVVAVDRTDMGRYTCLALNKAGERESAPASLTVLEKPTFRQMPDDVMAKEDDTIELKCSATGDPQPAILWQKESGEIPFGRARQLDDGTLWIEKVQVEDDGLYVCVADNTAGTIKAVGRLTVQTMPSFLIKPTNQKVGHGRTAFLQCVVTGNPPPTVFWSKGNDQHLMFPNHEHGRYTVGTDGTLRIYDVQWEDDGQFVCQGLNALGSEKAVATVTVVENDQRPPPLMVHVPGNQTVPVKDVAMLPCAARGIPPPRLTWYRDDRPLVGADPRIMVLNSGTLQISDLRLSDTALYTCRAFSETGEASWTAALTVAKQGPYRPMSKASTLPPQPPQPVVTAVTDSTVTLQWMTEGEGEETPTSAATAVTFLVDYFSHHTPEGWVRAADRVEGSRYTVLGLEPDTSYVFVVRARNVFGVSEPSPLSDPVHIQVTPAPPDNILIHKEDNSIHIRWSPPDNAEDILGYEVYCMDKEGSHNCSVTMDTAATSVSIHNVDPDLTYRLRLASRTALGVGQWSKIFIIGPQEVDLVKEPWFLGVVFGAVGGVAWLALCVFSIWLCRRRNHRKKMAQNGLYSAVPVHKSEEPRSTASPARDQDFYSHKDQHAALAGGHYEDLTSLLDVGVSKDPQRQGRPGGDPSAGGAMYSVATGPGSGVTGSGVPEPGSGVMLPQGSYYQKPMSTAASVAPYATTTLITATAMAPGDGGSTLGRSLPASGMEAPLRPVNHAYVHSSGSGSADSCPKMDSGRLVCGAGSDSSTSHAASRAAEDNAMHAQRPSKGIKPYPSVGKHAMMNWSEALPPPPEFPPAVDMNSVEFCGHRHQHESHVCPTSSLKAYTCPGPPHMLQGVGGARPGPSFSDKDYPLSGPPPLPAPRYPDLGPYPSIHSVHTAPPAMRGGARMGVGLDGGAGLLPCHLPPHGAGLDGGAGLLPCHLNPQLAFAGQGGREGVCSHHHHPHHHLHHGYYSDVDPYSGGAVAVSVPGAPSSLCGYHLPHMERGGTGADPRLALSDSEGQCSQYATHPGYPSSLPGLCEGPVMDRACQSSLPSLANECMHSPSYHSSRNADSPVSEEMADYAGETDGEGAQTTDCPSPQSSLPGDSSNCGDESEDKEM